MGPPLSILDYRQPVEFRISDVIVRAWTILSRHFLTFAMLVGIAELLPLVMTLLLVEANRNEMTPAVIATSAGIFVFKGILTTFAQAIVVYAAFQDLRGRPVDAGESLKRGLSRIVPVIVASVLTALLVFVGILLCLIPGLIALAAMAVVLPACVVEHMGPIEAMSRSADLTTGYRWPILAVGVAWVVITLMVGGAIGAAMVGAPGMPMQLAVWVWTVLSTSYTSVYAAILYHDLRAVREGIGIDEIASVFD